MKWKKENKSKLDGPDMDESPESNWTQKVTNVGGSKEYRDVGGDNQKVLLVENDGFEDTNVMISFDVENWLTNQTSF